MLSPKKQKFRKAFKGRVPSKAKAGTMLAFGSFGLKSLDMERVTARQIEAARRAATRRGGPLGARHEDRVHGASRTRRGRACGVAAEGHGSLGATAPEHASRGGPAGPARRRPCTVGVCTFSATRPRAQRTAAPVAGDDRRVHVDGFFRVHVVSLDPLFLSARAGP